METENYLPDVKAQYEELPYPRRNPNDERHRLLHYIPDSFPVLSHHCYGGQKDFRGGYRCLVAGGGTGDSAIYLAEQLRHVGGELVYLDMSSASRAIAQERARIRGLDNIQWITNSLLELPNLDLEPFDYINCSGVLHHLESTEDGLEALKSVLKEDGVIFLMLYAKYGRQGIYDMQGLLRDYLPEGSDTAEKISLTRQLLDNLPDTNSFQRIRERYEPEFAINGHGDNGLFDLFLHTQDRCFDVKQVYQLADGAGMKLLDFVGRAEWYMPDALVKDPAILKSIKKYPLRQRQSIGEQISCEIRMHEFYLSYKGERRATLDNENNAVLLWNAFFNKHLEWADQITPGKTVYANDGKQRVGIEGSVITKALFACFDGKTSLKKMYKKVKKLVPGVKNTEIRAELQRLYDILHPRGYMYLIKAGSLGTYMPDYLDLHQDSLDAQSSAAD